MKKVFSAALVVVAAIGSTPHGGPSRLQRDVDAVRAAGAVGVLAQVGGPDGRTSAVRSGVADPADGRPVPWDSYYRINSTTKAFTAVVVLQLVGSGRLALTDTVDRWLPGVVVGSGNDGTKVTVRQLLQHTSGLPEGADELPIYQARTAAEFDAARFRAYSPEQVVELAMRRPPHWLPAPDERRWAYSSTNYLLAGMIVEKVTGNSWEQEVHDRIIGPLGLQQSTVGRTAAS